MDALRGRAGRFSLLIAEDDPVAREMLVIMIGRTFPGVDIYAADNGRVGVEMFRQFTPEIVLTDINMPEMDGIAMAREIKSIAPETQFIILTAYNDHNSSSQFSEIGCDDYISKPIEFKKLFSAIQKNLDKHRL